MANPCYATDQATVYHGEALSVLAALPDGSVDAVITDPPYNSGGQYRGDRAQGVHAKYVQTDSGSGNRLVGFSGDNRDQRSFFYWCALWIDQCRRITAPGGIVALFSDWRQLPTITDALQIGGIVWRGILPWHKPNGRRTQGRFANNCEYVVWGTNGARPLDLLGRVALPGFIEAHTPREREHITQKPLEVMRQVVRIAPENGVILDPFAGSGSTGVAALLEGRRFVGIELDDHHVATTIRRLQEAEAEASTDPTQDMLPLTA